MASEKIDGDFFSRRCENDEQIILVASFDGVIYLTHKESEPWHFSDRTEQYFLWFSTIKWFQSRTNRFYLFSSRKSNFVQKLDDATQLWPPVKRKIQFLACFIGFERRMTCCYCCKISVQFRWLLVLCKNREKPGFTSRFQSKGEDMLIEPMF